MNTKTGFTLLVLSILVVPLLMIAVIIPMVFHFERPKDSIQEIDSIEDFKLYMESESGNKHAADDTENLLFVAVTDGIISASNIDGYNEGAEIRQEEFNNFLTKAFNPDSVQLLRQIPGVADMVIISLPFSINEMMTQGKNSDEDSSGTDAVYNHSGSHPLQPAYSAKHEEEIPGCSKQQPRRFPAATLNTASQSPEMISSAPLQKPSTV